MNTTSYQVESILADFNYVNVQKAMEAVNWKWCGLSGTKSLEGRVPSVEEVKAKAQELLEMVAESDHDTYVSTCGFTAIRIGADLQLLFILEREGEELHLEGVLFPGKKERKR